MYYLFCKGLPAAALFYFYLLFFADLVRNIWRGDR